MDQSYESRSLRPLIHDCEIVHSEKYYKKCEAKDIFGYLLLLYSLISAQKLANDLDILYRSENAYLRATVIVHPRGIISRASANGLDIGRNINEILRGLSVIQTIELMPCNRKLGEAVLKGYS